MLEIPDGPWVGRVMDTPEDLADALWELLRDLRDGALLEPRGSLTAHLYLGTDVDGTPNVNLDAGDRTLIVRYRRS